MKMHDLYSELPEQEEGMEEQGNYAPEEPSNYATRLAYLWIRSDPALLERCLECADDIARMGIDRVADEMLALVVGEAILVERRGLFFDLFTEGLREVRWPTLAASLLEETADEE